MEPGIEEYEVFSEDQLFEAHLEITRQQLLWGSCDWLVSGLLVLVPIRKVDSRYA
jgi:hypothetical protein